MTAVKSRSRINGNYCTASNLQRPLLSLSYGCIRGSYFLQVNNDIRKIIAYFLASSALSDTLLDMRYAIGGTVLHKYISVYSLLNND